MRAEERRRPDKVREHDGDLSAFGNVPRRRIHGRWSAHRARCSFRSRFEVCYRALKFAAVAEQNAELLQVLIRQIGQDAVRL